MKVLLHLILCLMVLFLSVSSSNVFAKSDASLSVQEYLSKQAVGNVRLYDSAGIQKFYEEHDFSPVWLKNNKRLNSKAKQVVDVLKDSWKHGLNPDKYNSSILDEAGSKRKLDDPIYYEMLMSASLVSYAKDITSMRIPPSEIGQKAKFWREPLGAYDSLNFVANDKSPKSSLAALLPNSVIYKKLREELLSILKNIEKGDKSEDVLPLRIRGSIHVGERSAIIEDIRYRLQVTNTRNSADPTIYDDGLAKHIMIYQEQSGLKPDGVIGKQTVIALNKTLKDRLNQIIVNMERVRWLSADMPDKYIVVNIPAQTLWAINDNKIAHEMPVIIGRYKRQTNSFVTKVTGVRFNPTWTVPDTIKFEDYLPKLKGDPNYLNDKGVEFYWGSGSEEMTLPPESIQWDYLSPEDIKAIRIVQKPSVTNPLGRVRLHMPNQYNIYLHDTSTPSKFAREDRALSSGCVRMSEPEKIADFVLSDNKNWSNERMQELLDEGKMRDIWNQNTIPVYLLYQTMWIDDNGDLIYGRDVYDLDDKLLKVLRKYDAVFPY